jgi:hypothetical protein
VTEVGSESLECRHDRLQSQGRRIGGVAVDGLIQWGTIAVVSLIGIWLYRRGWEVIGYGAAALLGFIIGFILYRMSHRKLAIERRRGDELASQLGLLRDSAHTLSLFLQLDVSLLNQLPNLVRATERETAVTSILKQLLRDCSRILGPQINRAYILRVAPERRLVAWVSYQMPESEMLERSFDLNSNDPRERGVAGDAFLKRELVVVHMSQQRGGTWTADHDGYKVFDSERPHPPYRSFAVVPILASDGNCRGILCLDSQSTDIFDDEETQEFLMSLGLRIGHAMALYEAIEGEIKRS